MYQPKRSSGPQETSLPHYWSSLERHHERVQHQIRWPTTGWSHARPDPKLQKGCVGSLWSCKKGKLGGSPGVHTRARSELYLGIEVMMMMVPNPKKLHYNRKNPSATTLTNLLNPLIHLSQTNRHGCSEWNIWCYDIVSMVGRMLRDQGKEDHPGLSPCQLRQHLSPNSPKGQHSSSSWSRPRSS